MVAQSLSYENEDNSANFLLGLFGLYIWSLYVSKKLKIILILNIKHILK